MADRNTRRPREWEVPNPLVAELIQLPIFNVLTADPTDPQAFGSAIQAWAREYGPVDRSYLDMRIKMVNLILMDELRTRLDRHTALLKSIGTGTRLTVERLDAMIDGEDAFAGDEEEGFAGEPETDSPVDVVPTNGSHGPLTDEDAQSALAALEASSSGVVVPAKAAKKPAKKRAPRKRKAAAKAEVLDTNGNVVG